MSYNPGSDPVVARIAVGFLGMVSLAVAIGATILAIDGREVSPAMAAIGTSAVTVLVVIGRGSRSG